MRYPKLLALLVLLPLLAVSPAASAQIVFDLVNSNPAEANPAAPSVSATTGNLLVVSALERSGTTEANFTISTTAGTTSAWSKVVGRDVDNPSGGARRTFVVWWAVAQSTGTITASVDNGTANTILAVMQEYESGDPITWTLLGFDSNDNDTATNETVISTGTTASIPAVDQLLIGIFGIKESGPGGTSAAVAWATSNLTGNFKSANDAPSNGRWISTAWLQETGAGTKASTATFSAVSTANEGLVAAILVFGDAPAGGGSIVPIIMQQVAANDSEYEPRRLAANVR